MFAVEIRRTFETGAGALFAAWTQPQRLQRWVWGSLSNDVRAEVDLRLGGRYRVCTARPGGENWAMSGEYLQIAPNESLSCTLSWDAPMGYEAPQERVTVLFHERAARTEMVFRHAGLPTRAARDEHEKGWNDAFDRLAAMLASSSA
jgi:uncharacterized protein YndB with AHSA1/START domain